MIDARDGEADTITCGAGKDTVLRDPVDSVAADCEGSTPAAAGAPAPAAAAGRRPSRPGRRPEAEGHPHACRRSGSAGAPTRSHRARPRRRDARGRAARHARPRAGKRLLGASKVRRRGRVELGSFQTRRVHVSLQARRAGARSGRAAHAVPARGRSPRRRRRRRPGRRRQPDRARQALSLGPSYVGFVSTHRYGLAAGIGAYLLWGLFPLYWPLLEPAGAGRGAGPPDRVVAGLPRRLLAVTRGFALGARRSAPRRARLLASPRADHGQLGRLHLRRQQRPGRRDVARLLHQPARHRRARRRRPRRAAAPARSGGGGDRGRRRARAHGRLRPAAVDRAHAGVLVRHLRPAQEAGRRRRDAEPRGRDGVPRLPALAYLLVARRRHLRHRGGRARRPAAGRRRRDRDPADALRRGGDPHAADDARAAAVHRAGDAVPDRRAGLRRADAAARLAGFVLVWVALAVFMADVLRTTSAARAERRQRVEIVPAEM